MTTRLLTVDEVANRLGVKSSTVTAYKARGQMPQPDRQYGRTPLWKESTIDAWRPTLEGQSNEINNSTV